MSRVDESQPPAQEETRAERNNRTQTQRVKHSGSNTAPPASTPSAAHTPAR